MIRNATRSFPNKRNTGSMKKQNPKSIVARASCRVDLAGGTLDLWPLYLFHPGAVTVNFALDIMTFCRITPQTGIGIRLKSLDTGKEDKFADVAALLKSRNYKHPLAGYLCRFFLNVDDKRGFLLETHSDSPAGAGISGSSALMIATTEVDSASPACPRCVNCSNATTAK